jgi:hypothetical protein
MMKIFVIVVTLCTFGCTTFSQGISLPPGMLTATDAVETAETPEEMPIDTVEVDVSVSEEEPVFHLLSLKEAGLANYGPCYFRALLAVAELHTGIALTKEQIQAAAVDLRKEGVFADRTWRVSSSGRKKIIDYALGLLGSTDESVYLPLARNLPEETQATIVHTKRNRLRYEHFASGDSSGSLVFDPLGYDTFIGATIDRIDAIYFIPQSRQTGD